LEQRTEEWFAARCGNVTASRVADVMARTRNGYGASRKNYMAQIIVERLTGNPVETYHNSAMQWGTDTEPMARIRYASELFCIVEEVGFIPHPIIQYSGASPDGLVDDSGLVEIKCPNTSTHIDTLLNGTIADKYIKQMQWQMACTGREWCDFVSFDPRMPEHLQIWINRIKRDAELISEIESEVKSFLSEVDEKINALNKIGS